MSYRSTTSSIYASGHITKHPDKSKECRYCHKSWGDQTGNSTIKRHLAKCPDAPTEVTSFYQSELAKNTEDDDLDEDRTQRSLVEVGVHCPMSHRQVKKAYFHLNELFLCNPIPFRLIGASKSYFFGFCFRALTCRMVFADAEELHDFLGSVSPSFPIPARKTLTANCCNQFLEQCDVVRRGLTKISSRPTIICDLWQDRTFSHRLGVSSIFIDDEWEVCHVSHGVTLFDHRHSSEEIKVRRLPFSFVQQILIAFRAEWSQDHDERIRRGGRKTFMLCGGQL